MRVYCVRIGNKYDSRYEDYIEKKLKDYDVHWIRNPIDSRVQLQWNKMFPMSLDTDEPVCVVDIDVLLINDYKKIFDYDIIPGQFIAAPNWWTDGISINGGFYKYYPKDTNYIFDEFMKDPLYWQQKYIKAGLTRGPVNGEQNFVEEMVKQELHLCKLPDEWFTRWTTNKIHRSMFPHISEDQAAVEYEKMITDRWKARTGNNYIFKGNKFHPQIKFVHFTNSMNKPHEWDFYDEVLRDDLY